MRTRVVYKLLSKLLPDSCIPLPDDEPIKSASTCLKDDMTLMSKARRSLIFPFAPVCLVYSTNCFLIFAIF